MRYWCICVLILLPSIVSASDRRPLRPLDALAAEALARAVDGSATARALVARLAMSDVIVHIESSRTLPLGIAGITRFVISRGGFRYLRVSIGADLRDEVRTAILAHELQHACEIADSDADDAAGLRTVFEHRGRRHGNYFETAAAIEIERNVRQDLRTTRALQAEPIIKFDH